MVTTGYLLDNVGLQVAGFSLAYFIGDFRLEKLRVSGMFDKLKSAFGLISVKEVGDLIVIAGFNSVLMQRDLLTVWQTSKVAQHIFTEVTPHRITFQKFFAIEVEYIFRTLIENEKIRSDRKTLSKIVAAMYENTWLKETKEDHANIIDLSKVASVTFKPMPEQYNWLEYYNTAKPRYGLKGGLLGADPGFGKTLAAIYTMLCREKDVIYIISPRKAIREVWEKTLRTNVRNPGPIWVADDDKPLPKNVKWLIFHYERLGEAVEIAKREKHQNVGICLDESHNLNLKTKESIRTSNFIELCKLTQSEDIIWTSGTALTAMGSEAIPLFRAIVPDFTPQVEFAMKKIWGKTATKANDILKNRLGLISFMVPKERFMTDKPIEATIKVKIPNGDRYSLDSIRNVMTAFVTERFEFYKKNKPMYQKIYDEVMAYYALHIQGDKKEEAEFQTYKGYVATFVKHGFDPYTMSDMSKFCNALELKRIIPILPDRLRNPFKDARAVIKYVDLKIKGECLGRILGRERIQCHVEMAKVINFADYINNSLKKTIVFTDFVPVLQETAAILEKAGYHPVVVYGDTTKELETMMGKFRKDPDVNPAVATYKSLAEAVPITEANTGLMLNKPFRFFQYKQAVSRMHRIGQKDPVYVFNFVLDTGEVPNISTRSEDIMAWSKQQVDELMGLDRYGSGVDDIELLDTGMESFDGSGPVVHSFLSAGMETYLDVLEDGDLVVEEIPVTVVLPQVNTAMNW